MTTHAQLALRLHGLTVRAFNVLPAERHVLVFPPLDAFIAQPGATNFLTAARALAEEQRLWRLERLQAAGAQHAFERGRDALVSLASVDDAVRGALVQTPLDALAGRRLEALALLVSAHQELASRAEFAADELRKKMGATPVKKLPPNKKKVTNSIGA